MNLPRLVLILIYFDLFFIRYRPYTECNRNVTESRGGEQRHRKEDVRLHDVFKERQHCEEILWQFQKMARLLS